MHMVMQLEYFEALQSDDISTLTPPRESYEAFIERMPRARQPNADDIFKRWELYDDKHQPLGVGERRAYLGWLTGIMEKEEWNFFWMVVVANRPDTLLMLAVVPFIKQLTGEVARLRRDVEQLTTQHSRDMMAKAAKVPEKGGL